MSKTSLLILSKIIRPSVLLLAIAIAGLGQNLHAQTSANPPGAAQGTAPKSSIPWISIKEAINRPPKSEVYIRARIVSVAEPRPNSTQPWSVFIADPSGNARMVIFQDTYEMMQDKAFLEAGVQVDIFARAGVYRNEPQLEIVQPNHVRRTPGSAEGGASALRANREEKTIFSPMTIGGVNIGTVGSPVRLRGEVVSLVDPPSERIPTKIILRDRSGEIEVIYWAEVASALTPDSKPVVGQPLEVNGIIGTFRSKMQLRVDSHQHMSRNFQVSTRGTRPNQTTAQAATQNTQTVD